MFRDVKSPMELSKIAFDTSHFHRDPIIFSQGSAIQVVLRLDGPERRVEFSKPNPDFDCVIYLTMDMKNGCVYHKTKDPLIHTVIYS